MTPQTVIFLFGALLILIGLLGGGLEIKDIKVPHVSRVIRLLSFVGGIVLIVLGTTLGPTLSPLPSPTGPTEHAARINVIAGSYGQNCGAPHGNVTAHLGSQCNNTKSCEYTINSHLIGDPAYGWQKGYLAEWTCGNSREVHSTFASPEADTKTIRLSCP